MKKLFAILLAALMLLGLVACGANEAAGDYFDAETPARAGLENYYSGDKTLYDNPGSGTSQSSETPDAASGQKLIRKIRMTVETDDYQAFIEALNGKIFELGGYIEDIEASTSGSTPRATIIIRVPANQLTALSDSVAGIGNVTYKHDSQQDVTLQYVDTESHILALNTEQDRLLELLEQAEGLSEVLEIEDRLASVRYQLDSYERSLRALANQVEYATATIEVSQVKVYTPTEEVGYWENIWKGLKNSLNSLWEFLKDLFSLFIISLPYLLIFVIIPLIIMIILLKRHSRKRKANLEAARQTQARQAAHAPAQPPEISEPRL